MANVLILEPSKDLQELYRFTVERLGHAVTFDAEAEGRVTLIIVEPATGSCLSAARTLARASPDTSVICASIEPAHPLVGLKPDVYLVKPFGTAELERALMGLLPPPN